MKHIMLFEQHKDVLNEAFKANYGLGKAISMFKKNPAAWYGDKKVLDAIKQEGVTSETVFHFASLFPRDSFKIEDIRTGKLEAQIKRSYFSGESQEKELKKAKALKDFVLELDKEYDTKSWPSTF